MSQRTTIKATVPNERVEDAKAILRKVTDQEPGWTHRIGTSTMAVGTELPGDRVAEMEADLAAADTDITFEVTLAP